MTARDRLVVAVLAAVAAVALMWLGLVSPKRNEASKLGKQVSAAQTRLAAAEAQVAQARVAAQSYPQNVQAVASLYRAVPADDGVPKLLVALDRTSHQKRVDFHVVTVGAGGAQAGGASATAAPGGLQSVPFSFTFNGGYIDLQHFLHAVDRYTRTSGANVVAHGRLLVVQSVGLTPQSTGGTQATVTATAYSQPPVAPVATPAGAASGPQPASATPAAPTPVPATNVRSTP
jgi:Tfp pilus assembly protein PilO